MRFTFPLAALAFSLAAGLSPVLAADCPVANDLTAGILFTAGGGADTELHTRTGANTVETLYTGEDGQYFALLEDGIYTVDSYMVEPDGSIDAGSRMKSRYIGPSEGLRIPPAGGVLEIQVESSDTTGSRTENARFEFSGPGQTMIGGCVYPAVFVDIYYTDTDPAWHEQRLYLPGLGTSIAVASGEVGSETVYHLDSISAVGAPQPRKRPAHCATPQCRN